MNDKAIESTPLLEELKLYCECGDAADWDEGMCTVCGFPKQEIWPNRLGEKVNEIIKHINASNADAHLSSERSERR